MFEHPWTAKPDTQALFCDLWLGLLGSGVAYLFVFRLFAHWGATRTTLVAYLLPVVGIVLGSSVLKNRSGAADHRDGAGHRRHRAGEQPVRATAGLRAPGEPLGEAA